MLTSFSNSPSEPYINVEARVSRTRATFNEVKPETEWMLTSFSNSPSAPYINVEARVSRTRATRSLSYVGDRVETHALLQNPIFASSSTSAA
jgi:hypothetical protein